eukprot:2228902-Lingulodinium_polyedra.AAC.1
MTLLSAMCALPLKASALSQFDSFLASKGTVLLRGEASGRVELEGGVVAFKGKSNEWVLKRFGLALCGVELRVQRIRWMQGIAKNPAHHDMLIAAVYGRMP